jgi:hypothetical protein
VNDDRLEERKRACNCDVNELLAKERQYMRGTTLASTADGYVFCTQHSLWVPFEWTKAA